MPRTRFRIRDVLILPVITIMAVTFVGSSAAVVLIRNEQWTGDRVLPAAPGVARVGLSFDADLTSGDQGRVRFSIGPIGLQGGPETILDFNGAVRFPRAVWTARFEVSFSLACDGVGNEVIPGDPVCWMRYVHPVHGTEIREAIAAGAPRRLQGRSAFELLAWDVSRFPGTSSFAIDAMACSGARTVGIYFDPAGTICEGTIRPDSPGMVYVVVKLEERSIAITGAEFRFAGMPTSWSAYPIANPEIVALGNPLGAGVTVAFPCYAAERGPIVLYSVFVLAHAEIPNVLLALQPRQTRGSWCPLLINCVPNYGGSCVAGEPCFVNFTAPTPCGEATIVQQRTWSTVKSLYRESR